MSSGIEVTKTYDPITPATGTIQDPAIIFEKKYLRALRMKNLKQLEKEYSKEIVALFREKEDQKKSHEAFMKILEIYKEKLSEIEFLKQRRKEIEENSIQTEKENLQRELMMKEHMARVEQKRKEFEIFMEEQGRKALQYVKRCTEVKKKLEEELHRYSSKQKVREEGKVFSERIVQEYKMKRQFEEEEMMNTQTEGSNILYKIKQNFHNEGNKIDYSTTRFHNIIVVKHEDEINPIIISAQEKAEEEERKVEVRKKSKEISKREFDKEVKLSSKDIIRKEKAKENLARLTVELNKLNELRNKSKQKANGNKPSSLINATYNDKKSEMMMNRILKERKSQRTQILNKRQTRQIDRPATQGGNLPDKEIEEFYKEETQIEEDDYLARAIHEHNERVDNKAKPRPKEYEEPIAREVTVYPRKEIITRLNPVDLESYNVAKDTKNINYHKENKLIAAKATKTLEEKKEFRILDYIKLNDDKSEGVSSSVVNDFFNDVKNCRENEGSKGVIQSKSNRPGQKERKMKADDQNDPIPEEIVKEGNQAESEFVRDDSKWKYSKQELYERKRKLLKDKSNLKKK